MLSPLEKFGQLIMKSRDRGIVYHDMLADARLKAPALQELQKKVAALAEGTREIVRSCVVRALDSAIHDLLFSLQEAHDNKGGIAVVFDGTNIAAESDGLQGEPHGKRGWIKKFSHYPEQEE